MKTKILLSILSVVLILATQSMPAAAVNQPGDMGVYFDAEGTRTFGTAVAFEPMSFWVIATAPGPIKGWEAKISFDDPQPVVTNKVFNPANSLTIAIVLGATENDLIVGLGDCYDQGNGNHVLVEYQMLFFSSVADYQICLGPTTPSRFGTTPGYVSCSDELIPASFPASCLIAPPGCGVLNNTSPVIAIEATNWGAVKAAF